MSDALLGRIRDEIRASGPVSFSRFMERALAEPGLGYYAQPAARPTREGDFLTGPELHPILGRALARQVDECWRLLGRPDPFTVREYGAGSGALAAAVVEGLRADGSGLLERSRSTSSPDLAAGPGPGAAAGSAAARDAAVLRFEPVELNPYRRAEVAGADGRRRA